MVLVQVTLRLVRDQAVEDNPSATPGLSIPGLEFERVSGKFYETDRERAASLILLLKAG